MNKKAIELSVNFLVIIVLSLVMLSLGVILINKFFEAAEDIKTDLDSQTEAGIQSLLEQGKMVAVPINRKTIIRGEHDIFGLGILNIKDSGDFKVVVRASDGFEPESNNYASISTDNFAGWPLYFTEEFNLDRDQRRSIGIAIIVDKTALRGTYIFDVEVSYCTPYCVPYDTLKKIFVQVP